MWNDAVESGPMYFLQEIDKGNPLLIAAVTVDDCLIGGTPENIKEFMDTVEEEFNIVRESRMNFTRMKMETCV